MVESQLRAGGITDERVLRRMAEVPRELFVPKRLRRRAYDDGALPIGHGQTISQPWVVAAICEALELNGDEDVLEIGTGSGYSTAILAGLVGRLVSVELEPELAAGARTALELAGIGDVDVRTGDAAAATGPGELFDAIAVHAVAPSIPDSLRRKLRPGGRLVIPLATGTTDMLTALRYPDDGEPERREIAPCRFVPLRGEQIG